MTPIAAPMRKRIARPYLVDNTVKEATGTGSGLPSGLVSRRWMTVDPCGAEVTGSLTLMAWPGGTMTTLSKGPTVSWDYRLGVLATVAFTLTRIA